MSRDPTGTDFARLEDRIEEKFDSMGNALSKLILFEERQAQQAERFRQLADAIEAYRRNAEARISAAGDVADSRISELSRQHQIVASLGFAWAVVSRFVH